MRPLDAADAVSLARHANDYDIWLQLRDLFPHPYGLEDAKQWIATLRGLHPVTTFGIVVDGEAVGAISLKLHSDVERCSAEIGYWLGAALWGRGIATDAVRSVARYGLDSLGLTRIYAVPFARNASSCRVLIKAGFALEGVMRKSAIKNGEVLDQALFALTSATANP